MCVRKGLCIGALPRTCIQGPMLFWGEFFLSSSPTLLGLALNTVLYPLFPPFGPSGGHLLPVNTLGVLPPSLALNFSLMGYHLPRPLGLVFLRASWPWERVSRLRMPTWLPARQFLGSIPCHQLLLSFVLLFPKTLFCHPFYKNSPYSVGP